MPAARDRSGKWFTAASVLTACIWLARLAPQAAHGTFSSDECFHATAMHAIARAHALPAVLPEFYSGMRYFYQPAFHVVGAIVWSFGGESALHLLPVAIAAVTLAVCTSAGAAGCGAMLALLTVGSFGDYATRLYADGLVVTLFVALTLAWCAYAREPSLRRAVWLGLLAGAAFLAKFTGLFWGVLLAWGALAALWRGERFAARGYAVALVIALAIVAPWWWRNAALFGSAFYPAGAPDTDRALEALNTHRYSEPPLQLLRELAGDAAVPLLLAAAGAYAAVRRRAAAPGARTLLAAFTLLTLGSAFGPFAALRHMDALVAVLALAGAALCAAAWPSPSRVRVVLGAAVLLAGVAAAAVPRDHRGDQEPPAELAPAFAAVRAYTPADARILSLWTYDTAYHTGRQATWPIPWGQLGHPVRLFRAPLADSLAAAMDAERIGWLLVPTEPDSGAFDSANHPADFMSRIDTLLARGALREVWASDDQRLLARRNATAPR